MSDYKELPCRRCGHVWKWARDKKTIPYCPEGYGCREKELDYQMNNLEKLQDARVAYETARVAYETARASYEAEIEATLGLAEEAFENILKIPNSDAAQGVMKVFARAALREIGGITND